MKKNLTFLMIIFLLSISFLSSTGLAKSKDEQKNKSNAPMVADTPKIKIKSTKPKSWQPELKVGLFNTASPVKLIADMPTVIIDFEKSKKLKNIAKNTEVTVRILDGKFSVNGEIVNFNEIEIRPKTETDLKNMQTKINDKTYFGGVKLKLVKNKIIVINIVTVEEYLRGVIPKEMSASWNEEALKAQTVAARTFALKNRNRHKDSGYDLCSNTHCQLYTDVNGTDERTDEAIIKTFGEVLQYNNKLIVSTFHTDSGGMTENAVDVWNTDYPYLRAATEIETKTTPWTVKFTIDDFSKKLAANGKNVGKVHFVKVTNLEIGKITDDRTTSGRVRELSIIGEAGEIKLTGNQMRSIFELKSTLFDIGITGNDVEIKGYGWGHGVGLSQYGAKAFAENGYTYEKILSHYYKGTKLHRLY